MKKVDAQDTHEPMRTRAHELSSLWPVHERYELRADIVHSCGAVTRTYAPAVHPELPAELAKLSRGDPHSVLRFAQEYGTLGYTELVAPEHRSEGEPLLWVWAHAETVQLCFTLTKLLKDGNMMVLRNTLRSLTDPFLNTVGQGEKYWPAPTLWQREYVRATLFAEAGSGLLLPEGGHPVAAIVANGRALDNDAEVIDVAQAIRSTLINRNIASVYRYLPPQDGHAQLSFGFSALIEMIYWHLADIAMHGHVNTCEGCGALFVQNKPTQRFCPPRGRQKESACAVRSRVKKHRSKDFASHVIAATIP